MNIVMFTNTFAPIIGGIEKSVETFCEEFASRGHFYRIITPEFAGAEESEGNVLRVPAFKNFYDTQFSVRLPSFARMDHWMEAIQPDILHSHQPFLLGDTALRIAHQWNIPLVFTHHTLYERYAHFLPGEARATERLVMQLTVEYANLCDCVIAPTESIRKIIAERGITSRVEVIPTGIDVDFYADGHRKRAREAYGIPPDATVLGHLGRLNREKNLDYLAEAVSTILQEDKNVWFLMAGKGELTDRIQEVYEERGIRDRLAFPGPLTGQDVADAYAAMDLFLFTSQTDTQGLVLAEAMAAGVPVVAIDAPGARDCIVHDESGLVLPAKTDEGGFAREITDLLADKERYARYVQGARKRAREFSRGHCAERMLKLYEELRREELDERGQTEKLDDVTARFESEWNLLKGKYRALKAMLQN